ncbi:Serine type site-specific recombinase (fragment) [Sulfurovum sp. enrichment culture clone C5]|uniref:Serine type site-specific recombinase n=1 Tax=Sulfurovum sp. enrichment culture clone C5 TaxID=497650 RepID=A0A0S4XN40_9BACT
MAIAPLFCFLWCPELDLNQHDCNSRGILSPLCLPFHHPGKWTPFVFVTFIFYYGAGEGIRTLDPNLGKVMLYP